MPWTEYRWGSHDAMSRQAAPEGRAAGALYGGGDQWRAVAAAVASDLEKHLKIKLPGRRGTSGRAVEAAAAAMASSG